MSTTLYQGLKLPLLLDQVVGNVALSGQSAPLSPTWHNTPLPPLDMMKDVSQIASKSRRRRASTSPQMINPLEEGMKELRQAKKMIVDCLDRIRKTSIIFDDEIGEANDLLSKLAAEQQMIAEAYGRFFNRTATHIQRVFRGHCGRKRFMNELHNKSAKLIQVAYRHMRARRLKQLKRFKKTAKKVIRGLRRIKKRKEMTHTEIMQRVHQTAAVEMNWRNAIGFHNTESVILSGYYHHKFVKARLKNLFKIFFTMNSIVNYWKQIVDKGKLKQSSVESTGGSTTNDEMDQLSNDLNDVFLTSRGAGVGAGGAGNNLLSKTCMNDKTNCNFIKKKKRMSTKISREELLARQKEYTKRVHDENQKRDLARRLVIEKQKETASQIEEKKRFEMELETKIKFEQALLKKEQVKKRGLLAIKEIHQKKEEEKRKQQEIDKRQMEAKQKIVQEMLSDQTQQILLQKNFFHKKK